MSKTRKITIIVLIILTVVSAAVFIAAWILKGSILKDPGRMVDLEDRLELTEGERITFSIDPSDLKETDDGLHYTRIIFDSSKDAEGSYIVYPVKGYVKSLVSSEQADSGDSVRITATVEATTEDVKAIVISAQHKWDIHGLEVVRRLYDSGDYAEAGYDEAKILLAIDRLTFRASADGEEILKQNISKYTIKIADVSVYHYMILISAAVGVLAIIVLIYALLGIKFRARTLVLGTVVVIVFTIAVAAFILRKDISTMLSVKEYCPGLYMARIDNDYKLDKMLGREPASEGAYLNALSQELFFGIPMSVDLSSFGCSAFAAQTPDGSHILGRNFDLGDTDGTIIYTAPDNGYRSIGVCDLSVINLAGSNRMADVTSLTGRAISRAFPYVTFDGMNEAGLGIAILSLDKVPSHPDTDKPDTYMLLAIRAVLDKCATVDDAIDLLSRYDVHSMAVYNYHLFLTDKTGHSVVAEWVDNEMNIIESDHVTNTYLVESVHDPVDDRYQKLEETLERCGGVMTADEAMKLLRDVQQDYDDTATEWSCVYDLDRFKVYIVSDMDWEHVYEITPESFG